jgi:hypothetical protein|tara:strand:- start:12024 stop:13679 length:1656 start_codon:yes stop_codon:yes gene_type:complete
MAKLGSILKNVGKATKRINPGKFFKGKKEGLVKGIKGGIKGLQQSKVKGKNSLLNVKSLEPIRPDLKQGGVRKVGRLVTNKVQSLVPKIAKSVTSKVNQFDPNALLGKIFDGGLNSLQGFASGLGGLKNSLQRNLEFLKEAKGIIVDLITKMAKAKPRGGGGFFKGLIKNIAKVGLLAMAFKAAPAAMGVAAVGGRVALGAGALVAGGMLAGKAFGAIKRRLQKKKQGADKIDGDKFNEIIERFQSELNMIEKRKRRRKDDEPEKDEQEEVKEETDPTTDTTESKVEPQEEVMGGSPNATLKIEEGGKMIITPTQGGEEKPDDKGGKESTTEPAAEKEKPQGLKRVAAGFMDQMTMGMFDFDQRGSSADGLMRFLKGDKGESGDKGNRGALGSKGDSPRRSAFKKKKEEIKNYKKFGGTGNEITIGNITYVPGDKGYEDAFNSITDATSKSGAITPLSEAKPAPSEADSKLEISKDISQPAIQPSGGGTGGGGTILPIPMPAQDKKRRAGSTPIQRTQNATKNVVPILPAIDMTNIHIQYSRSVFNIIDAM